MPGGKSKKFIDKRNSVTFYLAHRSQKDPLVTDETAPQRVLVPIDQAGGAHVGSGASTSAPGNSKIDRAQRLEEQAKYGIYFDDDYNYLQHLKDSKEVSTVEWDVCERIYASELSKPKQESSKGVDQKDIKLMLPSSVFGSEYEETIGMLNKAAPSRGPRPDLDCDVINAMEDDFDFDDPENQLEDDFIKLANEGVAANESELTEEDMEGLFSDSDDYEDVSESESADSAEEGESRDTVAGLVHKKNNFDDEETRSHFTNYSMSSSVLRRNEQLTLLDERFEKMYEDYDDTEIGALDCDDIEGFIEPESDLILQYAKEFEQEKKAEINLNEKISQLVLQQTSESDSDDPMKEEQDPKEKWDCETIISTYSTTKNRPRLIKESSSSKNIIKVNGKTGLPFGVFGVGLTKDKLRELDREYENSKVIIGDAKEGQQLAQNRKSVTAMSGISSIRQKDETPEERHNRKKLVKEHRRERRAERKANKDAFKDEKKRQVKVRLNCVSNVQGLKL